MVLSGCNLRGKKPAYNHFTIDVKAMSITFDNFFANCLTIGYEKAVYYII